MSTVRLKKEYTDRTGAKHPAGATVSVPFGVGQRLVADGAAEYPAAASAAPTTVIPAQPGPDVARLKADHAKAIGALKDEIATLKAENAALKDENAKLALELDDATKPTVKPTDKK